MATMTQVAVKGALFQSLLGIRAGLLERVRYCSQAGKARRRTMLRVRRDAVSAECMEVKSALRMLICVSVRFLGVVW